MEPPIVPHDQGLPGDLPLQLLEEPDGPGAGDVVARELEVELPSSVTPLMIDTFSHYPFTLDRGRPPSGAHARRTFGVV